MGILYINSSGISDTLSALMVLGDFDLEIIQEILDLSLFDLGLLFDLVDLGSELLLDLGVRAVAVVTFIIDDFFLVSSGISIFSMFRSIYLRSYRNCSEKR